MADPTSFRVALAGLCAVDTRLADLRRGAHDIHMGAALERDRSLWMDQVLTLPATTHEDLIELAGYMVNPDCDDITERASLGDHLANGILATLEPPWRTKYLPRLVRVLAERAVSLWCSALGRLALRLARRIARDRPAAEAEVLDIAMGIRAIARGAGVSRREAWALVRSGEVETFTLGGGPCAHRAALRTYRASR